MRIRLAIAIVAVCACMAGCVSEDDFEAKTLLEAAEAGDLEAAKFHYKRDPDALDKADQHGRTPVVVALIRGDHDVAEFLFQQGAKVPKPADGRFPVCHYLIELGDMQGLRLALANGANANELYKAEFEAKEPAKLTPLCFACRRGRSGVVALLLEKGADPNLEGTQFSPLTEAVHSADLQSVKHLVEAGAKGVREAYDQARRKRLDPSIINYLYSKLQEAE